MFEKFGEWKKKTQDAARDSWVIAKYADINRGNFYEKSPYSKLNVAYYFIFNFLSAETRKNTFNKIKRDMELLPEYSELIYKQKRNPIWLEVSKKLNDLEPEQMMIVDYTIGGKNVRQTFISTIEGLVTVEYKRYEDNYLEGEIDLTPLINLQNYLYGIDQTQNPRIGILTDCLYEKIENFRITIR